VGLGQDVRVWGLPSNSDRRGPRRPPPRTPRLPGILRFWPRVAARLLRSRLPAGSVIHAQRPEELLPFIALRPRGRFVVTIHGPHWRTVQQKFGRLARWAYLAVSAVVLFRADRVIAVSEGLADDLCRRHPWLKAKIRVIPPMIDDEKFAPIPMERARLRLGLSPEAHVVLYCGRLEREKNLPSLLTALAGVRGGLPTCELVVCGSGSQEESIRSNARSLGVPATFLGDKPPEEMAWVYASANVLALASEYEGFPTVVLEALACGRPVVSKSFPALEDLQLPDGMLHLSAGGEPSDLASKIEAALRRRPSLAPPATFVSAFSYKSVASRMLRVYRDIAKRPPPVAPEIPAKGSPPHAVLGGSEHNQAPPSSASPKSALTFVSSYSPLAVGGAGQFMIDLGTELIRKRFSVAFCYRAEPAEFELPPRVASARLLEVAGGPNPGLRTLPLLWRTALKLLAARSRIGLFHLVVPQPMTAVAALTAKILGRPIVATVFAPYPKKAKMVPDLLQRISEKIVLRIADVLAFECEATRAQYPGGKGLVVFNGIDTTYYCPDPARRGEMRAKLGLDADSFVVAFVGRVAEGKGIYDLLEAFAGLPEAVLRRSKLLVVGPLETDPSGFVSQRPVLAGRVLFVGPVGKDEVRDYYRASDLFVLPSYQEGISSSLVEAMACSVPSIVSNVGGNPEVVVDGECGYVRGAGDVNGLKEALTKLLEDEGTRRSMARRARERMQARFDLDTMVQGYVAEYLRLLEGRRGILRSPSRSPTGP